MTTLSASTALDVAHRIATRVASYAEFDLDGCCTWQVATTDREDPYNGELLWVSAEDSLYQGATGIALFLLETLRVTGDWSLAPAAIGGLRHAQRIATSTRNAPSFGLYSGRAGLLHAYDRAAVILEDERWLSSAEQLVDDLVPHVAGDSSLDVIGGAAGAIPVLLSFARDRAFPRARELALALGERILAKARRGPRGFSWAVLGPWDADLNGLAHGAAGFANALLELWVETGDARFSFAASQAIAYEREMYSAEHENWPDLRNVVISRLMKNGDASNLRRAIAAGAQVTGQPLRYMTAWCHGAPGIGLARLRALELVGHEESLATEARIAAATTRRDLRACENYSLCHGRMGNCETLLEAHRLLGDVSSLNYALEIAAEGCQTYELSGRRWPCGTLRAVPDPSLMLGEAGIGYSLLRFADENTPRLLMPGIVDERRTRPLVITDEWNAERSAYVRRYFPRGLDLLAERTSTDDDAADPLDSCSAVTRTDHRLAALSPEEGARFGEEVTLERARYELESSIVDWNDVLCERMRRDLTPRPDDARYQLGHYVRLIVAPPEKDGREYVVAARSRFVETWPVRPFVATLLRHLESPCRLDELVSLIQEDVSLPEGERSQLADITRRQLAEAYRAGMVRLADQPMPAHA